MSGTHAEPGTGPTPVGGLTLGFYGHAAATDMEVVSAYEDEVLSLMADHGGRVLFRGRRRVGESDDLPVEFHVLWFPDERALESYMTDTRRTAAVERFGDVFTAKTVVRLEVVVP